MDFYKLFGFLKILKESIKLLPRNGKVMSVIAILSLLLSCLVYFPFSYSVLSLTQDMSNIQKSLLTDPSSFNASDPTSFTPDLTPSQLANLANRATQFIMLLCAVEIAFAIVLFIISYFTTLATILVSAISYTGNTLSMKDLFYRIARSWKRPFATSISVSIRAIGYFLAVGLFIVPVVIYQNIITLLFAALVGIVAFIFYLYLLVIWILAIVVSVTEENCYGMVAMRKASTLLKGQILNGYMLNLFFTLLGLIISLVCQLEFIFGHMGLGNLRFYWWGSVLAVIFGCLVKILQVVAYTVLYFHCKNHHGEDTEIYGIVKYVSLPTTSNLLNA